MRPRTGPVSGTLDSTARRTPTPATVPLSEEPVSDRLLRLAVSARSRVQGADAERGDVPGWVMITLMTAGIVTFIWGFADDALKGLFENAVSDVKTNRPAGSK